MSNLKRCLLGREIIKAPSKLSLRLSGDAWMEFLGLVVPSIEWNLTIIAFITITAVGQ